jgi:hypothetical protein
LISSSTFLLFFNRLSLIIYLGSGKSKRIQNLIDAIVIIDSDRDQLSAQHLFVVHEGFSVRVVIDEYNAMMLRHPHTVILSFDVSAYASLATFARFLHHLYAYGLLIDEETGKAAALSTSVLHKIFIELPSLSILAEREDDSDFEWPTPETNKRASSHPYLVQLPILSIVVDRLNYIFVSPDEPFTLTAEARIVSTYWYLFQSGQLDSIQSFPVAQLDSLSDNDLWENLVHFFSHHGLHDSKRAQANVVRLLSDRLAYLARIHAAAQVEFRTLRQLYRCFEKFRNNFVAIFRLLVKESVDTGSDSPSSHIFEPNSIFVFSIRPDWEGGSDELPGLALFDILLCSKFCQRRSDAEMDVTRREFCSYNEDLQHTVTCTACQQGGLNSNAYSAESSNLDLKGLYRHAQVLDISEGCISGSMRAIIAPAFGMKNTSKLLDTITDMGYILTSESLVRILYMHERRKLSLSVIFEGDTGCGRVIPYS